MKTFNSNLKKIVDKIFPLISILVAFIIWLILASIINVEVILPSPFTAFKELFTCFTEHEFYLSLSLTMLRAVISFIISLVLAFILAVISYKSIFFNRLLYPLIVIAKGTPTISVVLICYLAVSPDFSPILIASLVIFPLAYSEILSHYNSLDSGILQACKVYEVDGKKILKEYVIPEIAEKSFYSSVSLLGFSVKLMVSAEAIIYTTNSLGLLMQVAKTTLQMGRLFAYSIVAILLGLILELVAVMVKKIIDKKRSAV